MCLSLSHRQPLYQLLSMSPLNPTQRRCQPSSRSPHHSLFSPYPLTPSLPNVPSQPKSCFRRHGAGLKKKRVVFADAKGFSLTAVRLFIPEPASPDASLLIKHSTAKLQGEQSTLDKQQHYNLRLGFPQPMTASKAFFARLRETRIQLGSCNISEHSLIGKVCVYHAGVEKNVLIRITFDSWRSLHDIPCTFLQQLPFGGSDMDIFSFDLCLPKKLDPREQVEFCVYFRPGPGSTPHWDDNRGQSYRLCIEKDGSHDTQGNANHMYPMFSKRRPSSRTSYESLNVQNSAEFPYLQRIFSN